MVDSDSITEYQIKSQENTVNHFKKHHDRLTKEVDVDFDNGKEDPQKMDMLFRVKRILYEQEAKLKSMKEYTHEY